MIDSLIVCADLLPEAKLCGADIVSVSLDLLHTLHISTVEDRERLLSAIYTELHPPTQLTQRLDTLLGTGDFTTSRPPGKPSSWCLADFFTESPNPCDVETLAAALVSMNKSKSSSHVSCLSMGRRSLRLRCTFSESPGSVMIYTIYNITNDVFNCRNKSLSYLAPRNSHLIEITINGEWGQRSV